MKHTSKDTFETQTLQKVENKATVAHKKGQLYSKFKNKTHDIWIASKTDTNWTI